MTMPGLTYPFPLGGTRAVAHVAASSAVADTLLHAAEVEFAQFLEHQQGAAPTLRHIGWKCIGRGEFLFTAVLDSASVTAFDPDAPPELMISYLRWYAHVLLSEHVRAIAFLEHHGAPPFLTLYREMRERRDPALQDRRRELDRSSQMTPAEFHAELRREFVERQGRLIAATFEIPGPLIARNFAIRPDQFLPPGPDQFPPPDEQCRRAAYRAETLLREWLSPAQLAQYDRDRTFEVVGSATGARYRIAAAPSSFNVWRLDERGRALEMLCFVPEGAPAKGDVLLAQKIALETDERNALEIANRQMLDGSVLPGAGLFGPLLDRIFSLVP